MKKRIRCIALLLFVTFFAVSAEAQEIPRGRALGMTLSTGFGMGLPLGMPPAKPQPSVWAAAPDDSGLFVTWSGVKTPDAASKNRTEMFLADPEINGLIQKAVQGWHDLVKAGGEQSGGEAVAQASLMVSKLIEDVISQPGTAYVTVKDDVLAGGFVSYFGDKAGAAAEILDGASTLSEGEFIKNDNKGQVTYSPAETVLPIEVGIVGEHLIVGFGKDEFASITRRVASMKAPAFLKKIQTRLPVDRVANITYINIEHFAAADGDQPVPPELVMLGLDQIRSVACVTGLDKDATVVRTWEEMKPGTELTSIAPGAVTPKDLSVVPKDARAALASSIDFKRLVGMILEVAPEELLQELEQIEDEIGLDLVQDVIGLLGDKIEIYESPSEGGLLMTGWTAVVSLSQPEEVNRLEQHLEKLVAESGEPVEIRKLKNGEDTISYLWFLRYGPGISPAWCVKDNKLIIGTYPQSVMAFLNRKASKPRLSQNSNLTNRLGQGSPDLVINVDEQFVAQVVYPFLQLGMSQMGDEVSDELDGAISIDVGALPSLPAISQHLGDITITLTLADDGLEMVRHQTLPPVGLSLVAMVAAFGDQLEYAIAPILDKIHPERIDRNHLRELAIAMHNYHDAYQNFPGAAVIDAQGKPLLSWRVQILPFLGEQQLYEQFRLDEPWDSPHNKKLIAKMPEIYQTVGVDPETNKTAFLSVVDEKAAMRPDGVPAKIFEMRDGTSNTIMFVRAKNENATIWTKPDDIRGAALLPKTLQKISGGYMVAMYDGSVAQIRDTLSQEEWGYLVDPADGEFVDYWDGRAEFRDVEFAEVERALMPAGADPAPLAFDAPPAPALEEDVDPFGMTAEITQAKQLAEKGDHAGAITIYRKVMKEEPDNVDALVGLGKSLYATDKYKECEETFKECVKLAPERYESHLGLGKAVWIQDRNEESKPHFKKAIDLNEGDSESWLFLGLAHNSLRQYEESIPFLSRSIQIDPDQWYPTYMRGNAYYEIERNAEAIADYTKAFELRPSNTKPLYYRSFTYQREEELDKAIADMSAVIAANPLDEKALGFRGEMYKDNEQAAFAVRDYSAVIGLNPKNDDAWKERGRCWMDLGEYEKAIKDQNKGLDLKPDQWTFANRAISWENMDDYEKAAADYSSALKLDPDYEFALTWRAYVYAFELERYKEAKVDYERVLKIGGEEDTSVLGNYAWFLAACPDKSLRDGNLALRYATKGAELTQWKEAWIIANLAASHASLGDFDTAIAKAKQALTVAESDEEREEINDNIQSYLKREVPSF